MPEINALIQAKDRLSDDLLNAETPIMPHTLNFDESMAHVEARNNIHAVGVGRKIKDGKVTRQKCVRIYVVRKMMPGVLSKKALIPPEIDGIPTDVIESSPAYLAAGQCSANKQRQQRPIIAGISAGHPNVLAGTIGCLCRSTRPGDNPEDIFALSNNHVFANVNRGLIGDRLIQPAREDGGSMDTTFARLDRFVPLGLGPMDVNRVDAAIGRVPGNLFSSADICSIGSITGHKRATLNLRVSKHGRTTGLTIGTVDDPAYNALINIDPTLGRPLRFVNQIRIKSASPLRLFARQGDSGSLVVDQATREAVGLLFAVPFDNSYGVANHIDDVLTTLNIRLI